ncbi:MAG: hypothetical protein Q8Q39_01025, partial [bacterium]|nr:hypothetical protein [bacterium]
MNSTFNKIGSRLRRHAKHWRTGALENFSPTRSQRGVIMLFTILGVGTLALGAALTVAIGSLTELSKNRNTVSGDQVFYTGEAAVSEGAYRYLTASSYLTTAGQMLNNTSTSTVEVTPLSWPYVKAKGKAANDRTHRGVVRIITQYPEGLAFDYAIYAQNDLGFGGNATVNGNVYSSTQIDFTGNSSEVNGNAFSPGDIESDNVSGFSVTGIDPIPPPSIDIEPYRVIALAAGTYFTSTPLAKDYLSNQTRQAVVVVEDAPELKLQNSTQLTGSLVTENDLELTGGTYSATGTYAAIVVY